VLDVAARSAEGLKAQAALDIHFAAAPVSSQRHFGVSALLGTPAFDQNQFDKFLMLSLSC